MADPTRATKNWPDLTQVKNFWPGPITTKNSNNSADELSKKLVLQMSW